MGEDVSGTIYFAGGGAGGGYDSQQDTQYEQDCVTILVDRKSDLYIDGTTIDFYDDLSQRGFVFNNPNANKTCGCGSSFRA